MGLPIIIPPPDYVSIVLDFAGVGDLDITARILRADPIHEYMDDDNSEFRVSEWSCEIDNSDDYLATYNWWRGAATEVNVVIRYGSSNDIIWVGTGPAQVFNSANNTLVFTFKHEFEQISNYSFGPTSAPWDEVWPLQTIMNGIWNPIFSPGVALTEYLIDLTGFNMGDPLESTYTWNEFSVEFPYWQNSELDGLVMMGDFLRLFGAVLVNRPGRVYRIIDRRSLLAQSPVDVSDDLLGAITEERWDKQRKKLRITTTAHTGPGNPGDGLQYITGYKGDSTANLSNLITIEANMMYNVSALINLPPPDDIRWTPGVLLAEWIYETMYEPWYKPGSAQTQMSFTLAGLSWFPGDAVQWDANFWVLIEETEKDLGNRKTRCTGLKVIV